MKKQTIFSVIVGVVVVLAVGVALVLGWRPSANPNSNSSSSVSAPGGGSFATTPTRAAVPANAVVVNEDADDVPPGTAVPQSQITLGRSNDMQYRSFAITVTANGYSPSTIVVNHGDVIDLAITAAGGNYGFAQPDYGYDTAIPEGATKRVQFQALLAGDFTFYCASCGGPSKGPVGHLVVE